jgi:hypothetical protein
MVLAPRPPKGSAGAAADDVIMLDGRLGLRPPTAKAMSS